MCVLIEVTQVGRITGQPHLLLPLMQTGSLWKSQSIITSCSFIFPKANIPSAVWPLSPQPMFTLPSEGWCVSLDEQGVTVLYSTRYVQRNWLIFWKVRFMMDDSWYYYERASCSIIAHAWCNSIWFWGVESNESIKIVSHTWQITAQHCFEFSCVK